jgi:DNA polymerase-3 subunit epsilon
MVRAAVVARDGTVVFDARMNPGREVEPGASEVHGMSDEHLGQLPGFAALWPDLRKALEGRRVVIFNQAFDTEVLVNDLARVDWPPLEPGQEEWRTTDWEREQAARSWVGGLRTECAMLAYAKWFGECWYNGRGEIEWVWQKLPRPADAPRDAAGDCRLVWDLLQHLAQD